MTRKRGGGIEIIVIIVIYLFTFHCSSKSVSFIKESQQDLIEKGSFSISNTTDSYVLFENLVCTTMIGTTWNLTITVDSFSSSEVNFTFESSAREWFEGVKEFQVSPNNTISELYVAHGVSDDIPHFNFHYTLVESVKKASGTYQIDRIHPGYPVNVGTGHTYIPNITAWLEGQSKTTSVSTSSRPTDHDSTESIATSPLSYTVVLIGITGIVIFHRKRNRKRLE